jgi:hypothetical protein
MFTESPTFKPQVRLPPRCISHDCQRHGTTTLFAALNALDGTVIGRNMQRHRLDCYRTVWIPAPMRPPKRSYTPFRLSLAEQVTVLPSEHAPQLAFRRFELTISFGAQIFACRTERRRLPSVAPLRRFFQGPSDHCRTVALEDIPIKIEGIAIPSHISRPFSAASAAALPHLPTSHSEKLKGVVGRTRPLISSWPIQQQSVLEAYTPASAVTWIAMCSKRPAIIQ